MTKPATASEYMTMPVATVVGGTSKLFTMPPSETGSEATLKDMITWPSAMTIIGIQDSRASVAGCVVSRVVLVSWVHAAQASGCDTNRSMPRLLRQEFRDQLAPDAVARGVERRRERAEPPLPGETVTMPPPMPLLPGRPMS